MFSLYFILLETFSESCFVFNCKTLGENLSKQDSYKLMKNDMKKIVLQEHILFKNVSNTPKFCDNC